MAFTANDVKELREMTGCGMMDCKKALSATDGDKDKAIEFLREKGLAAQQKKAGRIAAEGVVVAIVDEAKKVGAVLEVNIETDFAANNKDFIAFANNAALTVIKENPTDVEDLLTKPCVNTKFTVGGALTELSLSIRENMKIRRFVRMEGELVAYVHAQGKIGVMVEFETDCADKDEFKTLAKDIAMQVAANAPQYTSKSDVPDDVIENEKKIQLAAAMNEGKPQQIAEKMVMGRMGKFYAEICLLEQESIKEEKTTVAKVIEATAKKLGGSIKVLGFTRYERGEGIEKKADDFASEVASMIK